MNEVAKGILWNNFFFTFSIEKYDGANSIYQQHKWMWKMCIYLIKKMGNVKRLRDIWQKVDVTNKLL